MAIYGALFALALFGSLCLTPLVRAVACRAGVLDLPDGRRKLHPRPIPKLGGVGVFVSFYICLALVGTQIESPSARQALELASATFVPSLLVLTLGIVDDKWPVNPWMKIAVQIAAGLVVYYDLGIRIDTIAPVFLADGAMLGLFSLPATLVWVVLITNAFNVVDGMDGLATGVAFIALACMFLVSLQMNQPAIAFAAASLAGAVLGFLRYNFHPASIFLGDSGSLFLGFQLAVLSIVGSQKSSTAVAVTAPVFVLALPLVETATSAVRRFVSGRSIMQADSAHIHHQLIRLGCTPRRAAGILYLGSGAFGLASLFVVHGGSTDVGLIAVSFFAVTVLAIQQLGYTEFAEINGALRRFVSQRKIIENGIVCRKLAADLANVSSIGHAWSILRSASRRLGFSYVELTLHTRSGTDDLTVPRYAERLMPRPGSAQPPETTFAVALAGRLSAPGQVVFSRSTAAPPLHSELPLLINAVAEHLPRVIERHFAAGAPPRRPSLQALTAPGADHAGAIEWKRPDTVICAACGSPRLHRSRTRSSLELLRKKLTARRLYECDSCGWRGWQMQKQAAPIAPVQTSDFDTPDLRALDLALQNVRSLQQRH
jgi:UDP-GlcNAc:undecaprenyl-phosphate GlcNAc-1-phosphate transferase